jgi:hypothetical protein
MNRLPLAVLAAFTTLVLATPAGAVVAPDERPLPNTDVRTADGGPTTLEERRARAALERSLGDEGIVSNDRVTGGARMVARTDGFLTGRRSAAPDSVALGYVRARPGVFGLEEADLDALRLTSRYRSPDGVTHLAFTQTYLGIDAYDNVLLANLDENGRLLNIGGAAVSGLRVPSIAPGIDAGTALAAAKQEVRGALLPPPGATRGRGAERPTRFSSGDKARLTLFGDGSTTRLAWRLQVTGEHDYLYEVILDATSGEVLKRRSLTEFVSRARVYRNFPGAPSGGAPEPVDLAADPTWLNRSGNTKLGGNPGLSGNNAYAYADADAIDDATAGDFDIPPSSGTDWDYPVVTAPFSAPGCPSSGCTWNPTDPATRAENRNQSTTQLFYLVNTFHDHLKAAPIGFTHAARGFEFTDADGPAGSGVGGDPLLAETDNYVGTDAATIKATTNNASMSTPPDGESPWLETYFFTDPALNATDTADIVYHEYTHGFTNRTVGSGAGLSAVQSRALGEGWSDWYALDFLVAAGLVVDNAGIHGELEVGAYLLPGGFRWQGLDCPVGSSAIGCSRPRAAGQGGFTLGDMSRIGPEFEVHDVGEIWAQTLWDLRRVLGSQSARALVSGGLRLSPDNPSFLEARDAIIQADQAANNGANYGALWQVFAARGMGFSAAIASSSAVTASEAFDLPPGPAAPPAPPAAPDPPLGARAPAKLEVLRAGVTAGKLDVLASITTRATGTVRVRYRSAGATTNFTAPIRNGRISFRKALPRAQRSKPTGIFTLSYGGNAAVQPDSVRLRAALGKARLVRTRSLIDSSGRLRVSGTISPRARGVVRIRYGYIAANGSTEYLNYRAKITAGAWSLTTPLPNAAARAGGQLSIQFTGYEPRRIRGEQLAKAVAH